jgi:hypothetical protein
VQWADQFRQNDLQDPEKGQDGRRRAANHS